jgi:transcriptional regulator with XRE-family HTH domain
MVQGSLAHRLRVLRAERGLTLREAASLTGVAKETISDIERGLRHPHDPTIAKIAKGYGVPVDELLEEPVPLAEASQTRQTEVEERDTPGVAPDVLSRRVEFTAQLADVLEAEIERVEQDRTFPYFAWDYRTEATISHLTQQLGEDGILAYVAEVREGRRMAQNEGRRLAVALAANLSRLRHLAERAHVIAQILHVDSHVEGVKDTARPVADVLEEWERASVPSEARHD